MNLFAVKDSKSGKYIFCNNSRIICLTKYPCFFDDDTAVEIYERLHGWRDISPEIQPMFLVISELEVTNARA